MKFPTWCTRSSPSRTTDAAGGERARHVLGLVSADCPSPRTMLMWVMSDRAIPAALATMPGFGVHHLPAWSTSRRLGVCKIHLNARSHGHHSLVWDEAVKISGADPTTTGATCGSATRPATYPEYELGPADLHRGAGRGASASTSSTRPRSSRRAGADPRLSGRMVLEPQPRTTSSPRPSRCLLHRARRSGHRLHPTIRCSSRPHPLLRRHADLAPGRARTSTRSRSTRRRAVHNNQRDGMHRQAIHRGRVPTSPTRWRRLPVPGRRRRRAS
jgi:catalase